MYNAYLSLLTLPVKSFDPLTNEESVVNVNYEIKCRNVRCLTKTLTPGSTSVFFGQVETTRGTIIQVGTSKKGVDYSTVSASNVVTDNERITADYTVTLPAQSDELTVFLILMVV